MHSSLTYFPILTCVVKAQRQVGIFRASRRFRFDPVHARLHLPRPDLYLHGPCKDLRYQTSKASMVAAVAVDDRFVMKRLGSHLDCWLRNIAATCVSLRTTHFAMCTTVIVRRSPAVLESYQVCKHDTFDRCKTLSLTREPNATVTQGWGEQERLFASNKGRTWTSVPPRM